MVEKNKNEVNIDKSNGEKKPSTPPMEKTSKKSKKNLIIILAAAAAVVVATVIVICVLKFGGGLASPTNDNTNHYVTDQNGVAVTNENGEAVTVKKEMIYVDVTDADGKKVTDADGNVVTTGIYKDFEYVTNVPVTDASGNAVTNESGSVVTTEVVLHQDPNKQDGGLVVGTTIVHVTDGKGHTGVDQNGKPLTTVVELTSNPVAVEPAALQWKTSLGGTQADYFSSIALTKDGSYITANVTNSKDGNMSGFKDTGFQTPYTVLTKYNDNGGVVWQKAVGGKRGNFEIIDLLVNADGTFYGVGYGKNIGDVAGKGYYDSFVAKYDKDGNQLWVKTFGTSTVDYFEAAALTADGGVVAVGSVGSNDKDAAGFGKPANKTAACIVKYDKDGNVVFKNIVGGNGDSFKDVAVTPNGNIFCVGRFTSGTLFECLGMTDSGVVKFNSKGELVTVAAISGTGNDLFSGITACKDGGVVVVGRSNSSDDGGESLFTGDLASRGGYDAYIIKYADNLDYEFANPFRGQNDDDLVDVVEKADGTFVAVGCSDSSTRDFKGITTRGGDDIVIASFDKNGDLSWARSFGGTLDESATAVCLSADGGYAVAGRTLSKNIDMNGISQYVGGKSVGVIAKFPE